MVVTPDRTGDKDGSESLLNEKTPLIAVEESSSSTPKSQMTQDSGEESAASGSLSGASDNAIVTLDEPWPRTFERSISLLAGPHLNAKDVNKLTKSPRFGHFRSRKSMQSRLKQINKPFRTPEAAPTSIGSPSVYSDSFNRNNLQKIRSLDFGPSSRAKSTEILDMKQAQAKIYRAKILAQTGEQVDEDNGDVERGGNVDSSAFSPGFSREKKSMKMKKEAEAHGAMGDEKSSLVQSIFNMANILMGVGLLGLPYVLMSAGWVGGIGTMLTFGGITWRTSILIGRELNGDPRPSSFFDDSPFKSPLAPGSSILARMRKPVRSFPEIARETFGESGCIILASVLYFELFSCLGIFFVSLGEHLHELYPSISTEKHMVFVAVALTVPTAVLRTPKLLSYLSAVGTFATVAVVSAVVISAAVEGDITADLAERESIQAVTGPYHNDWKTTGIPVALGLTAYSFSGHAIVPSIYTSMKRPQDFEKMITITFSIVLIACLLVGTCGYYMFGNFVEDQVTLSLASYNGSGGMQWLTWLMVLTAFSKFTLTMFPLALGIEEIVAPCIVNEESAEIVAGLIRFLLIVSSLLVAIFFPSFSFLCSLVGLICTMVVSVIFPAAAHLAMFGSKLPFVEKFLDYLFIIFGTVAAVVGTIATMR
uniref:Amino acid transporter transmembrane domain-containing protein n=1 Tax=Leptocylindrus danicus TaxID=163516 RepID=A0A7S2NTH1_9STRA|mmetsp:Transcript_12045/g.18164  ORF Transcript_12045/g.18164 Transcript_12045/m.18164 type:complete len:651 (+) Transcript_12045:209-2161(+)